MTFSKSAMRWVGIGAVVLLPIAHLEGVDRFAQLPQVLALHGVALLGVMVWFFAGRGRQSQLVLPALLFCFFETLSIFWAHTPIFSLLPIATHLAGTLFLLAMLNGLDEADFRAIAMAASGMAAVISVLGLLQFVGIGRDWVPTAGLPSATMGHRNIAAAYLVGTIPLTLWCYLQSRSSWATLWWAIALGLEGAFLLATRSRGAWLGLIAAALIVGCCVLRLRTPKSRLLPRRHIAGLAMAAIVAIGIAALPAQIEKGAGEAMWHGKQHLGDAIVSIGKVGGDKGRWSLWWHTAEMILDHPFGGVGAGNWRLVYPAYSQGDLLQARAVPHRPHSDPLWIWSEMGILGLLAYLWLLASALKTAPPSGRTVLDWVLVAALLGPVLNSLFSFPRAFPAAWLPFYLALIGIGVRTPMRSQARRPILLGFAIAILILSAWTVMRHIRFDRAMLAARVAFLSGDWPGVLAGAQAALDFGPLNEEIYLMRGRACAGINRAEEALASYQMGLRLHPHSVGLWNGVGQMLRATGDVGDAQHAFRQALRFDPLSGETHNNLGTLFAMSGTLDSARASLEQAIVCEPGLIAAYANLSHVYRRQGDPKRALEMARSGLARDPSHLESRAAEGSALLALRQFAAAAHAFSQLISAHPDRAEFYFNLAQAYDGLGQIEPAMGCFERFLDQWEGDSAPQVEVAKRRLKALRKARELHR